MENLVQLQQGSKGYGAKTLFDDASFSINENEHVGVIGPNGAGKTTLFKILIDEESLDEGKIIRSRQLRLGYLSQHDNWEPEETIESYLSRGTVLPIWELKAFGTGLGLTEHHYSQPVARLSGGYRMRAKLLHLIGQQPSLMLLDEPTNYLDLETLMVLEKFLQGYQGAFLLISHDREFLRRTTDHILEVEGGAITKFNGNIDDYFEQKQLLRAQLETRALSLSEKRKEILDFVARFGAKATKASQAQSRLKSLDRMETIEIKPLPVTAKIRIPPPVRVGKIVLTIRSADLGYPGRTVLQKVDLQLKGGDHLAVVGLNGAGKTTLLKALSGSLEPLKGSVEYGYEVSIGYFAQHVAEELNPNHTVLSSLQSKAHSSILPQEILDLAGSLLFSGKDIQKPVRILSGGERSRVALGQVLLQKASCLILDEPTNHLDFQTVEALTQALHGFSGSLVIVSHDRSFIRRVGTKIFEIHNGKASAYPGSYDEYVWSLEKGAYGTLHSSEAPAAPPSNSASVVRVPESLTTELFSSSNSTYKEKKKSLDRRLKQLETLLSQLDRKLSTHQARLTILNQEITVNPAGNVSEKIQEMGRVQTEIENFECQWLEAGDEKEAILKELHGLTGKLSQ